MAAMRAKLELRLALQGKVGVGGNLGRGTHIGTVGSLLWHHNRKGRGVVSSSIGARPELHVFFSSLLGLDP